MVTKRRFAGAAAGCAVVIATAIGTPVVNAQDSCIECPIDEPGPPVTPFLKIFETNAFLKISDRNFQGEAFHKIIEPFIKIGLTD